MIITIPCWFLFNEYTDYCGENCNSFFVIWKSLKQRGGDNIKETNKIIMLLSLLLFDYL